MSDDYADRIKAADEKKKEEGISLIEDQIELEKKLINMYEKTSKEIQSKPVRYLLDMIKLDSMKHILTFQTALEILQGESVMKEEKSEIIKGLYTHIELEKEAIEASKKIIRNEWIYQNAGLNELIKKWGKEEKEHHKILRKLVKKTFFRVSPFDSMFMSRNELERRSARAIRTINLTNIIE